MSRILMVLDREFPPDIRVENEIQALIEAGHEVHLACYTKKNRPALETSGKLTIHRKKISDFIYKSSVAALILPFYFKFWTKFISELMLQYSFDAIHIHDLPLAKIGLKFKKKKHICIIIDLHENWPAFLKISRHTNTLTGKIISPIFLWRHYEKKMLAQADQIIVVVEEAKDRLKLLGIPEEKISIVSNTINLSDLDLINPEIHNDIILYYAGGINYHRGLQNVVSAMNKSKNLKIKFWILGDGSYLNELKSLVNDFSLQDRVIFQGYQPFKKVMKMLFESDFAVIPHLKSEHTDSTIPHKLFQYMYAQKPIIASDCLPIKRIIEDTDCGIIYKDWQRLAEILDSLESLDSKIMAQNGKDAVVNKYNWDNDSSILLKLYDKV